MKTVLIITYYWPPSGGSGVQRWLKFANYLSDFDWHPIVVTPENPQFELRDPFLEREVGDEIEVLKLPIWEPYQLFNRISGSKRHEQGHTSIPSWAKFIRGNLFLPDPRIFWKRPVVKFLSEYLKQRHVDCIISTGPPHSMHLIARKLSKRFDIPWVADFRDPWSRWDMLDEFHSSNWAKAMHRRLEEKVIRGADVVLTVSDTWAKEFESDYHRKVEVITNGFDPADFQQDNYSRSEKFRIAHVGLINEFRYDRVFWEVMNELCKTQPDFADDLEVDLYGVIDHVVRTKLEQLPALTERLNFHGTVSHEKVLEAYGNSAAVLMFMNRSDNARGHIPGKLFEYLAAGRPILAFGDPEGDAAGIINTTGAGRVIDWDDKDVIAEHLLLLHQQFRSGSLPGPDTALVNQYSRKVLTEQLAKILDQYA